MWKKINDLNYEVNDKGKVRNCATGRLLKASLQKNGYLLVTLYLNGKRIYKYVHRLVAENFLPNPMNYKEVNHKDEDKSNNCIENLEWCDRIYNARYGTAIKRASDSRKKSVVQYDLNGKLLNTFKSATDAAILLGLRDTGITAVCRGEHKSYHGFKWSYTNNKTDINLGNKDDESNKLPE